MTRHATFFGIGPAVHCKDARGLRIGTPRRAMGPLDICIDNRQIAAKPQVKSPSQSLP